MKRVISLIMALALCFGLCACGASSGSQFVGEYEVKYGYIDGSSHTQTLIINGDGTGTFKSITTNSGEYYKAGDVREEASLQWTCEGNYITITFSGIEYKKGYGENTTEQFNYTKTYEKKAGTLHDADTGGKMFDKIS